nr:M10 family metallopeptidase C-terminal domain-containing protein [Serratia marcescens]
MDSGSAFSGQKGEIQLNFDAFNGTTDLLMNTQSNSYAADFKIHVVGQVEQSDICLPEVRKGKRKGRPALFTTAAAALSATKEPVFTRQRGGSEPQ